VTGVSVSADLDWDNVDGATSYDVYFGTSSNPPYYGSTASTSYSLPTLGYGTHYYWKIVAKNACGQSTSGPVWDFTTQCLAPGTPTLSSPANWSYAGGPTPEFTWSAVSGAVSYRIQVDNNSNFGTPEVNTTTSSLSYTPASPLPPDTYYWRVRASNSCGDGPWSSEWNLTILGPKGYLPVVLRNYP
jgi:hypothetical protein